MSRYRWILKLSTAVASVAVVAALAVPLSGQDKPKPPRIPVSEDWSTRHVIFSNPGTFDQPAKARPFLDWYKVQADPRYQFAQARRNAARLRGMGGANPGLHSDFANSLNLLSNPSSKLRRTSKAQGDWSNYLGGTTGAGIAPAMYPAKYTFDINAPPDCVNDFVVVPVHSASTSVAPATGSVTINADPLDGDTVTIGSTGYIWQSSCASIANCVIHDGTPSDDAAALAAALMGTCGAGSSSCTADPDVTVSSTSGNTVNLSATAAGAAGNSVVLTIGGSGNVTPSGSTLSGGVDGQASLIAFNNLYTGGAVAASQVGAVSSNGATTGSTVTINSVTLTASDPTAATATITVGSTIPAGGSSVKIGAVTYTFRNTATVALPAGAHACNVRSRAASGDTAALVAGDLFGAITNSGAGATTWMCAATATPNPLVSAIISSPTLNLTAAAQGSTGFAFSFSGANTNFSAFNFTAGSDGANSGLNFAYWSGAAAASPLQLAFNLTAAINNNTGAMKVSASSSGNVITVTATTPGPGANTVAIAESLGGFAWGGATLVGGMNSGPCTGPPHVMWAYDASTAATASPMLGSPVLSSDGTKVAFIESASTGGILHVLLWKAGDGAANLNDSPLPPTTSTSNGPTYTGCVSAATTSCMFNLGLGTHANSNSQPFYNYATDELYVGDNSGRLWKVLNVFNGTPTLAPAPWHTGVVVDSGNKLTSPVLDFGTGKIFVADAGGRLSSVDSTGVSISSISGLGAIVDSPIVDSTTGRVLVFSGGNGTGAIVEQTDTSLTPILTVNIGNNSPATHVHAGTFDNNYFNDVSTGRLFVCGKQATHNAPALYRIGFNGSGNLTGINGGPLNLTTTNTAQECSPPAEVFNQNQGSGGVDWLFVGIPASCAFGGSATGCIIAFDITSGFPTNAFATAAESGGTSGMIEDNVSTEGQTSSIYFTTLTSPGAGGCDVEPVSDSSGCLVKVTQAGLQ